ncbi:MAG: ADP-glyceromanno-heptose 6-epimerase [Bacteroidia bacterium]|nr:ADP-glyceromanno-heptose 6-epimerase [Bacteroidia bacterium]
MIIVTGACGFIGSALLGKLQELGYGELIAVDDFSHASKLPNLVNKNLKARIDREEFPDWLIENAPKVQFLFHIGARTRTNEFDWDVLNHLNVDYSKKLWNACTKFSIPFIYASSAATYGNGEFGFDDNPEGRSKLKPMNPYGESKQLFDLWVEEQAEAGNHPPFWAGFKFFNVFGPNEYHKGRMASVVFHAFNQIKDKGEVSLFKSYRYDYPDGGQRRDFVYVKDVLNVLIHFMENRKNSGIYNLGSGQAHTFLELATGVFEALNLAPNIKYVDMPEDIRNNYQYFTQAAMDRVRLAGYSVPFWDFKEAIHDYVAGYLEKQCAVY